MKVSLEKPGTPEVTVFLAHHGILGMKWGHRKETDSGSSGGSSLSSKQPWSTKKKVAVGAGVTVGILAAYGAYKYTHPKVSELSSSGDKIIGIPFVKKDALARKMTTSQIMKEIVPQINPGFGKERGTTNNCLRCSFAYELRRRGYDVTAGKTLTGASQNILGRISALSGAGFRDKLTINGLGEHGITLGNDKDLNAFHIFNYLSRHEEGARGEISMAWRQGSAHSMSWEIIAGKVHIFDTQTGEHFASPAEFNKYGVHIIGAAFTRLDNIDIDEHFLANWVKNVG